MGKRGYKMLMTRGGRLEVGAGVTARELNTVAGESVRVPDPARLVHLQFRRFAGCPICDFHLRSFVRRQPELAAANVREVVLFHSSAEELRKYVADLPFALVADPHKRTYADFGVVAARRALSDPRVWLSILFSVLFVSYRIMFHGKRPPPLVPSNGRFGLPADFLIAPDGRVLASKYGEHADDQWSVDELLTRARDASSQAHGKVGGY
jgi:peroxiredoxin